MIFRRELRSHARGLIVWSLVLGGLGLLILSVYPSFAGNAQTVEDMLNLFPGPIAGVFGMDVLKLGTYAGFYGVEVHLINTLAGSVYAALLAAGMLAGEENDRTAEFLLTRPVTRTSVALQKLAAVLANLFALNAVIAAVGFACTGFADEAVEFDLLAWYMLAAFLLHGTVASVSFLLSAAMRRTRSVVSLALGIVFLSYALHIMAGLSDRFDFLRHVSLFSFTDAAAIVENGGLDAPCAAVMVLVSLLCALGAIGYYHNKDIAG